MNTREDYYKQIIELLTAFIREKRPFNIEEFYNTEDKTIYDQHVGEDVQAILTILGRRNRDNKQTMEFINLDRTNLYGAHFEHGNYSYFSICQSYMVKTVFWKVELYQVVIHDSILWLTTITSYKGHFFTLRNSDLSFAKLVDDDMMKINGYRFLTAKDLVEAKSLYNAQIDANTLCDIQQSQPHLLLKSSSGYTT